MNIAFCTDNNYVMPCGITIVSLLENNTNEDVSIHIVGMNLSEKNKELLKSIVDKYNNAHIFFYNIDKAYLDSLSFPINEGYHINISTYIRLFLPGILPENIEKVLYLDCDIMVLSNLSDLWATDIKDYSLAGVIDSPTFNAKTYQILKYSESFPYINAGVLLMNLKYWRDNNITNRLLEYIKANYESIKRVDQDVINGALHDSIHLVPIRYNMHNFFFWRNCNAHQYNNDVKAALKDPAIVHFTTSMKPWLKGNVHPMQKKYLGYKNLSPWKDVPIVWGNLTISRKIRYYRRIILDTLGIKKHKFIKM